jgi:hypothetical protein
MEKVERDEPAVVPTEIARGIAARVWCMPKTSHIVMDTELAEEFACTIERYRQALIWCSGSEDFGPGGKAEEGWNKTVAPLLR